MIYLFGDLHGSENILRFDKEIFPIGETLTKEDYIIILGDFGIPWARVNSSYYYKEMNRLKYLSSKPWTTLFLDGNHENFENLQYFPIINKFNGKVAQLEDNIFHLKRGEVYTIDTKTFFIMGGALSIDKIFRIEGISWWNEEEPSRKELNYGLDNLEKNNNKVDYILTHTCSNEVSRCVLRSNSQTLTVHDPLSKYFDKIEKTIDYKKWFFGHFHIDKDIYYNDKIYYCLYNDYYRLDPIKDEVEKVGSV